MRFPDLLERVEVLWDAHAELIKDWNSLIDELESKGVIDRGVAHYASPPGEEGRPPAVAEEHLG